MKQVRKGSIKEQKSEKILILSFLMMLCIVWTHSRIPIQDNVPNYFSKLQILNEIGQDAVAPFFLITSFLFFRYFQMDIWLKKLKTRWHSLFVPYLIWNCIGAFSWWIIIQQFGRDEFVKKYQNRHFCVMKKQWHQWHSSRFDAGKSPKNKLKVVQ